MAQLMFKTASEPPTDILAVQPGARAARWWRSFERARAEKPGRALPPGEELRRPALRAALSRDRATPSTRSIFRLSSARMDLTQTWKSPQAATDPGMVRSHTTKDFGGGQDRAHTGWWVLADGMGGYNAGEVASGMRPPSSSPRCTGARRRAPYDVRPAHQPGDRRPAAARPGAEGEQLHLPGRAKPAAVSRHGHHAGGLPVLRQPRLVAHLGDSRLYVLRDAKFKQVTPTTPCAEQIDSA